MEMKADKVRELDSNELRTQLRDSEEQMFRLKFQMSMGQTDGLKKYRQLRRDRARMLTILDERKQHPDTNPEPETKAKKGKKRWPTHRRLPAGTRRLARWCRQKWPRPSLSK
jgi:large subunit ribosomal protein L29